MEEQEPLLDTSHSFLSSFFASAPSLPTSYQVPRSISIVSAVVTLFNGTVGVGLMMLIHAFSPAGFFPGLVVLLVVFGLQTLTTLYLFDSMARTNGTALAMEVGGFPTNAIGSAPAPAHPQRRRL